MLTLSLLTFEGEKEYSKVIANKDYYIYDANKVLMLA